jgi:hypothetical protein
MKRRGRGLAVNEIAQDARAIAIGIVFGLSKSQAA